MNATMAAKFKELVDKLEGTSLPHGALACSDSRRWRDPALDTEQLLSKAEAAGSADFEEVLMLCDRIHELEAELDFLNSSYALDDDSNLTASGIKIARNARALIALKTKNERLAGACKTAISEILLASELSTEARNRMLLVISAALSD